MKIKKILADLAAANNGKLRPQALVDAARAEDHPLHNRFCWDDTKAAKLFRLSQAQTIIRMVVTVVDDGGRKFVTRAYVSPSSARGPGSSYTPVATALRTKALRDALLDDARRDAQAFCNKYEVLRELAAVFVAMRKTRLVS